MGKPERWPAYRMAGDLVKCDNINDSKWECNTNEFNIVVTKLKALSSASSLPSSVPLPPPRNDASPETPVNKQALLENVRQRNAPLHIQNSDNGNNHCWLNSAIYILVANEWLVFSDFWTSETFDEVCPSSKPHPMFDEVIQNLRSYLLYNDSWKLNNYKVTRDLLYKSLDGLKIPYTEDTKNEIIFPNGNTGSPLPVLQLILNNILPRECSHFQDEIHIIQPPLVSTPWILHEQVLKNKPDLELIGFARSASKINQPYDARHPETATTLIQVYHWVAFVKHQQDGFVKFDALSGTKHIPNLDTEFEFDNDSNSGYQCVCLFLGEELLNALRQ
jgi:hypothetical protein